MSYDLVILHTADSHIGAGLPARSRTQGRRRGHDLVQSFGRVVRRALTDGADLLIHCGDLFDEPHPSELALAEAAEPLLEIASEGIHVVVVPGNHERSAIPVTLLLSHANIHIVRGPTTLHFNCRGLRVAVSALPCLRRDSSTQFRSALAQTGWQEARADCRILAMHQTLESAVCGPAGYRFRSGPDVIERTDIPSVFNYVACGHVHRHQRLKSVGPDHPPIVYSGSPDRISFAEIDELKGYVLVRSEGGRLQSQFVEHDVRPMAVTAIAVHGQGRGALLESIEQALSALPPEAVAQLRLTGNAHREEAAGLRLSELSRRLRPDVTLTVTAQGLVIDDDAKPAPQPPFGQRVFDALKAPDEPVIQANMDRLEKLPRGRGVYALFDKMDRLLYIGKATDLRSRIQAHRSGGAKSHRYPAWTTQVVRVEARPAYSDLECLLMEAELVRLHQPPFNQQMRKWGRYCYVAGDCVRALGLRVVSDPLAGMSCFGPFRSRSFAADFAEAVMTELGEPNEHEAMDSLATFLSGADDGMLRRVEAIMEAGRQSRDPREVSHVSRRLLVLRSGFDHLAGLRSARRLMGRTVVLPGLGRGRRLATFTGDGIEFRICPADANDSKPRSDISDEERSSEFDLRPLSKSLVDSLMIADRAISQNPEIYRSVDSPIAKPGTAQSEASQDCDDVIQS